MVIKLDYPYWHCKNESINSNVARARSQFLITSAAQTAREAERLFLLKKMIQKHVSKEEIMDYGFSQDEYAQAEQSLLINA